MRASLIIMVVVVAIGYKFLYFPIPDGIEQKLKFRGMLVFISIIRSVCAVIGQFNGKPVEQLMNEISLAITPTPPSTVAGSNIRSRFTTFDGVRVLLYEPITRRNGSLVAGLVFFHGGGYIMGSPEAYDDMLRSLADKLDIVIASVDYCLSTTLPFPAAHEDAMKAATYFLRHTAEFGVDPTRVGVMGDSAGGHLAAAVAQELTDDPALPRLRIQVLIYPLMQFIDTHTPSMQQRRLEFGLNGGIIPKRMSDTFRSYYLHGRYDDEYVKATTSNKHTSLAFKQANLQYYNHEFVPEFFKRHEAYRGPVMDDEDLTVWEKHKHLLMDVRVNPLLRKDLSKLPPAYVMSCQFDGLRDDAIMYVTRLKAAGVKVHSINYHNGWHAMFSMPSFLVGERSIRGVVMHLKDNL